MPVISIPVLTYHSISDEPGPTSIPAEIFARQMETVKRAGIDVIDIDQFFAWRTGAAAISKPSIAITFDDAFQDFADAAYPVLKRYGFPCCVFVPSAVVGGEENWCGANEAPRKIMDWATIKALSNGLVTFGSHTCSHADLTQTDAIVRHREIVESRADLEDRLGKPVRYFAPPYGHSNQAVQDEISNYYALSFGVRLGKARLSSPLHDIPRIEMHYYRDIRRWRDFLTGRGGVYFELRRAARGVRETVSAASKSFAR